jgi:hypothetical protein
MFAADPADQNFFTWVSVPTSPAQPLPGRFRCSAPHLSRKNSIEAQSEAGIPQQTELDGKFEPVAGTTRRNACDPRSHAKLSTDIWIVTAPPNLGRTM